MPEKFFQWMRSSDMTYVKMVIHETALHDFVDKAGTMNNIQFTDLNYEQTLAQRRYVSYIRRCDEMEKRLEFFDAQLKKFGLKCEENIEIDEFLQTIKLDHAVTSEYILSSLENLLEKQEISLRQLNDYNITLTEQYNEKVEQKFVLELCSSYFMNQNIEASLDDMSIAPAPNMYSTLEKGADSIRFGYITGVLDVDNKVSFERMIFRATRGNCLVRFIDITTPLAHPQSGKDVHKTVFLIFYRSSLVESKVRKIIDAYNGHAYNIADFNSPDNIRAVHSQLLVELEDSENILNRNINMCEEVLRDISKYYRAWEWNIKKEKSVYDVFNKFKQVAGGSMYGEGWILTECLSELTETVEMVHHGKDANGYLTVMEKPWPKPPTHFHTNEFTSITQCVVDTYGVPSYKECNPAVFTLVTFPFQFGIMFGDLGHALFITIAAIYFLWNAKKMKKNGMNEIISMIFSGRCMLILMGIYAMYVGFMYNDQFSIGVDWFGSTWEFGKEEIGKWTGRVYPAGLDPAWHDKANSLLFYNSFKMKFAVIFGVAQMIVGVVLKFMNNVFMRDWVDFFCEAIPQMLFMLSFFGWMVFLIIYKWIADWDVRMGRHENPPQLINTLINFALKPGTVTDSMFEMQGKIQFVLLIIMVMSVPWMLLIKPIYLAHYFKKHPKHEDESELMKNPTLQHEEEEPTSFGELFIFQGIETIEYCLGCISHTASYLRLWALSLAHSQLSEVFWDKILQPGLDSGSPIALFVLFIFFALVTIGVLLVMDALECYLHALRLHWVEFQTKFYAGKGYKFTPLNFHDLLVGEDW